MDPQETENSEADAQHAGAAAARLGEYLLSAEHRIHGVRTESPGSQLRALLARKNKVLPVFGVTSARIGQVMEFSGVEAGFVGTHNAWGNYHGLADAGVASSSECTTGGGWIARAVNFPCLLDGDTGHGGRPAIRRLVQEAIREGLAGIRIDDQPLELKRMTQANGIRIIERDAAIERYRTVVEARNEIDPSFVVMAQCYARDAENGSMDELLERLHLYETEGGVDWVQFEVPHSVEEIRLARDRVAGYFSAMQGRLPQPLSLEQHRELGMNAAWYTFLPTVELLSTAAFLADFAKRDTRAWLDFAAKHATI